MMKKNASLGRLVWCVLLTATTILNPLFASTAHASTSRQIVIGEVAWAGSTLSTADEWIELWNISDAPIAVGGWSLVGMGESGKPIHLPADAVILARGAYLVSNYPANDARSVLATDAQVVTTTVSLSNSSLRIELLDSAGNLIDSAGTGGVPPAGSSGTGKIPMVRTDISQDGAIPTVWSDQAQILNLKPGNDDSGTPGICDSCMAAPQVADNADTATTTAETYPETLEQPATTTQEATPEPLETTTSTASNPDASEVLDGSASTTEVSLAAEEAIPDEPQTSEAEAEITIQITSVTDPTPTASTTTTLESAVQTTSSTTAADIATQETASPAEVPQKPNYGMLRLNEISPAPASGKEWIEIISLDETNTILLKGCEIHDRQGRLMTLGATTLDPKANPYTVVELSSARLNNDGDVVALYCDSRPIDAMSYPATTKGSSWIREPDKTGAWRTTSTPTAGSKNAVPPVQATTSQNTTLAPKPSAPPSPTTGVTKPPPTLQTTNPAPIKNPDTSPEANIDENYPSLDDLLGSVEYHEPNSEDLTDAKASADKNAIIPFTFDMLDTFDNPPIRVRLEGAVGSIPGLLPYHSFVLLSPEGRGLQIRVPAAKRLPEQNLMVSVTGNLLIDDRGRPYLKMTAKDELLLGLPAEGLAPRIVDLELPDNSDAWAYVSVTGTVKSVKTRTVILELGGLELAVNFKTLVKFRPQRLLVGDTVRVAGILDLTSEEPKLLPRTADDVVLLKHAEVKQPAKAVSGPTVPGWTPFGAAAGAVALTEGTKHYRKKRQQKMLERKLEEVASTPA